jgi:hypothetical protein
MSEERRARRLQALSILVGATIEHVDVNAEGAFVLGMLLADGKRELFAVACDDEGNGPGALLGLWQVARKRGLL